MSRASACGGCRPGAGTRRLGRSIRGRRSRRSVAYGEAGVFFFQAEDGIRDLTVTGVQTCALPIFVVITGLSGSGKSSLAFDTIYAEGQRRYVESLSAYARQFLEQMEKPEVDSIE